MPLVCRKAWGSLPEPTRTGCYHRCGLETIERGLGVIRHEKTFVRRIESYCRGKDVLEIGCGDGTRLGEVARTCMSWIGIDPGPDSIEQANKNAVSENTEFLEGSAEDLPWPESTFDVAVFTLSLHHIDIDKMPAAIDEAVRVLRPGSTVLFLEPMPVGTFFDAEMHFGCCDGDERKLLAYANYVMLNSERLREIEEFTDQVSVEYDSFDDFKHHVPTNEETHAELEQFLSELQFTLNEKFRLNVFQVAG